MPDSTHTAYLDELTPQAVDASSPAAGTASGGTSSVAAVELIGVAQRLGHRWALRGVALRVEPGEVIAIVGPNGSGKTTLLRVVSTALTPTRGAGRVFGRDLASEADAVREVTGMLGHATGLYDDLTGAENLEFAQRMYGQPAAASAIDGALEAVGMQEHRAERVRGLSSGMRRRIALARLMLRRPRLLLLDEPYNTFDATGVAVVDALIRKTARSGGAVLVVTHDLTRTTGAGCDRVVTLDTGRVTNVALPGGETSA
ncbi:MAG: heme ABC exporter ATP-binding protein CcmA [Gemmatimonadota bacterium]|nr:heme ABC exporter ATP-binding protein CcmA [Gemmatimonadota bacterium]